MSGCSPAGYLARGGLVVVARRGEELVLKGRDGRRMCFWRIDAAGRWRRISHVDAGIFALDAEERVVPILSI